MTFGHKPPPSSSVFWLLVVLTCLTACYFALDSSCMDWPGGQGCDLKLEFLR